MTKFKKHLIISGIVVLVFTIIFYIMTLPQCAPYPAKVLEYKLTTSETNASVTFEIKNTTNRENTVYVDVYTKKDGEKTWRTRTYVRLEAHATVTRTIYFSSRTSLIGSKVSLDVYFTSFSF